MKIRKGDIYIADLEGTRGSEQGGVRPVLIIQNYKGNKHSPTTIVACLTSRTYSKASIPTHYYLPPNIELKKSSLVMCEQIRTIDKSRLQKKIGHLSEKQMYPIYKRLIESFGIPKNLFIKPSSRKAV